MDLILKRNDFSEEGIFGEITDTAGNPFCVSLEHAFSDGEGHYTPVIPSGTYTCQRGQHQLLGMAQPFETFQVMNVPGHTNILIHCGNQNSDSSGCILLGLEREGFIIIESRSAFKRLMDLQSGLNSFHLRVE